MGGCEGFVLALSLPRGGKNQEEQELPPNCLARTPTVTLNCFDPGSLVACLGPEEVQSVSGFGCSQYSVVIWVFGDFTAVFGVANSTGAIDDEHGAAEAAIERTTLDQDSVVFAEF